MLPSRPFQQRIVVSGLVWSEGRVLLFRASHSPDVAARARSGYFDIPRLTVPFGTEPAKQLHSVLQPRLDQPLSDVTVLDVTQRVTDEGYTQEVEVLYQAHTSVAVERPGRMLFVAPPEVARYMFAAEYERLRRYLTGE